MASSAPNNADAGVGAFIISPSAETISGLTPILAHALPGVQIHPLKQYPSAEELADKIHAHSPRLCFLDVVTNAELAIALISQAQSISPALQTVVLLQSNTPDLILRCLRLGAAEFLIHPFSTDDLKPVLARLSELSPSVNYGKGGKVVCVAPTKGACGASTIASNLAHQKKRLGANRLLLADLDPMTGTISFLLKLKSNYSILDALARASSLDEDLWNGMVATADGIDVLLAPENPMDTIQGLQDPTPVIEFARQLYDLVIVDCAGVFSDWGIAIANACNEFLLVTTNELPALQATQRVLAHFERNRIERSKIRLVVNRYSRDVGLSKDAIATALHADVCQVIPSDYEALQRATVEGRPVSPGTPFGKGLVQLVDRIAGHQPPASEKSPNTTSLTGIFATNFSRATS
jgi:pilus assembly protein CpaE